MIIIILKFIQSVLYAYCKSCQLKQINFIKLIKTKNNFLIIKKL